MIAPDAAAAWNPHARNLTNVLVQATCGGARRVPGQTNFRAHGTKERPTSVPPQHAQDINVSCAAGRRLRRWGTNLDRETTNEIMGALGNCAGCQCPLNYMKYKYICGGAGNRTQVRKRFARASTYVAGCLICSRSRQSAGSP